MNDENINKEELSKLLSEVYKKQCKLKPIDSKWQKIIQEHQDELGA